MDVPSDFAMSPRVAGGFPIFEACVVAGHLQPAKFQKAVQHSTSGTVNVNGTSQNAQADGVKRVRDLKMKKWGVLFFVPRCLAYIIR
jgi:hypothetical protein